MDIEDIKTHKQTDKERILKGKSEEKICNFILDLSQRVYTSRNDYDKYYSTLRKKHKLSPSKIQLLYFYKQLKKSGKIAKISSSFEFYCIKKIGKSHSGIINITVLTSPFPEYTKNGKKVKQSFSCGEKCSYCPTEPARPENNFQAQPKSYIYTEPAVLRANANKFDAHDQFENRANSLELCGHTIDKIELFILGGTWSHYPKEYREQFIRDLYYAANTYNDNHTCQGNCVKRKRLSLQDEITINETAKSRIIGLTIETRPDCITKKEIIHLRQLGVTRIQIGVQHLDDDVLRHINRNCTYQDTVNAIRLWKKNCGKIDIHIMPDLPGSDVQKDMDMFDEFLDCNTEIVKYTSNKQIVNIIILTLSLLLFRYLYKFIYSYPIFTLILYIISIIWINDFYNVNKNSNDLHIKYNLRNTDIQADQWKIYPTMTTRWTDIKDWYDEGTYKPYSEYNDGKLLIDLLIDVKLRVFPFLRLNRVIRDIPTPEIFGGIEKVNLRQDIHEIFKLRGLVCKCIRCREVKTVKSDLSKAILVVREYESSGGIEYFISYESPDKQLLYGFLRLRINFDNDDIVFPILKDSALIRELHVYGQLVERGSNNNSKQTQHSGFGKRLLKHAEYITVNHHLNKISIIAGVGVREYYRNRGYEEIDTFMVKYIR